MKAFHFRVSLDLDYFRFIQVDFVADGGFLLIIHIGFRKFWWISIFRPTDMCVNNLHKVVTRYASAGIELATFRSRALTIEPPRKCFYTCVSIAFALRHFTNLHHGDSITHTLHTNVIDIRLCLKV